MQNQNTFHISRQTFFYPKHKFWPQHQHCPQEPSKYNWILYKTLLKCFVVEWKLIPHRGGPEKIKDVNIYTLI